MVALQKKPVALDRNELRPTPKGYLRIFDTFYRGGTTQKKAFDATENYFEDLGHSSPYTSFESFRQVYNRQCHKDLAKK